VVAFYLALQTQNTVIVKRLVEITITAIHRPANPATTKHHDAYPDPLSPQPAITHSSHPWHTKTCKNQSSNLADAVSTNKAMHGPQ
jgi:hypothetical protein